MPTNIKAPIIVSGQDPIMKAAINVAFTNLVAQLNQPPSSTVDMNNNRVTGVNWPSLQSDAVPLGYLKSLHTATTPRQRTSTSITNNTIIQGGAPGGSAGPVSFTPKVEGYAMFTVEPFTVIAGAAGIDEVDFNAFSIDETDLGLFGTVTISSSTAVTTLTFTTGLSLNSRFGRVFGAGDYIIFNDAGSVATTTGKYEICGLNSISSSTTTTTGTSTVTHTWVLSRGQLGSVASAHGTGVQFFRLIPRVFTAATKENSFGVSPNNGVPTFWEWAWANKCVVAVAATARGAGADGTTTITNLAPSAVGTGNVAYPGLRTMNGAAYVLTGGGNLQAGQTADSRVTVQSWHSIRTVYGILRTPPTGSAVNVSVYYISSDRGTAGLIDNIIFGTTSFRSYPSTKAPASQQIPYHNTWTPPTATALGSGFPPNVLPIVTNALDTNGNLVLGGTLSTNTIVMAPDGEIDFLVTQAGTSGGGTFTLLVQS